MKAIRMAHEITTSVAYLSGMMAAVWIGLFVEIDTNLYVPLALSIGSAVFGCISYWIKRYEEWKIAEDYRLAHYFNKYHRSANR